MKFILPVLICLAAAATSAQDRKIAFTFDDLPVMGNAESLDTATLVTADLLKKLKAAGIRATGFVNEKKLFFPGEIDRRTALLKAWLENGHDLGNHTFSHIAINNSTFEDYTEDVLRGETVTKMLLSEHGKKLRYFRHTQLRTGPTDEYRNRLNSFLAARDYTIAPVTIDSNEYLFALRYREAKQEGNKAVESYIAAEYLKYMELVTKHFEMLSRKFLGYEVPQIILLHANELNADHFDELADIYKRRRYGFISLDEALRDPAYKLQEVTSRRGLSWIHRWMLAKGLEMIEEPAEPEWTSRPR